MTEHHNYIFTLFGATGDLAFKKLIPALYQAVRYNSDLSCGRIICVARSSISTEDYLNQSRDYVKESEAIDFDDVAWEKFSQIVTYITIDVSNLDDYQKLFSEINQDTAKIPIYYLSLAPSLFETTIKNLAQAGLAIPHSRLVIEKPLGHDLQSAQKLNALMAEFFTENQIYRIDHYLGKESVQNLMALRFGNRLLEPLWNRTHIRSVQITIAEHVGIGNRGDFYDATGAIRDMVQNHLLQLLCFIAMEPPYTLNPDAIRDEKLKVLRSLKLYTPDEALKNSAFGHYDSGFINGLPVRGYVSENNIPDTSITESFFAAKIQIENWRWSGVPFYIRTGKRMAQRMAEIVISFRNVPHHLFNQPINNQIANKLVISLQPKDSIELHLLAKPAGQGNTLKPVKLSLDFEDALSVRRPTAYERLLCDIIKGDLSLFVRQDELEEAWRKIEPFLHLSQTYPNIVKKYAAGSWGTAEANALVTDDKTSWHENFE